MKKIYNTDSQLLIEMVQKYRDYMLAFAGIIEPQIKSTVQHFHFNNFDFAHMFLYWAPGPPIHGLLFLR
jgi:hypothetical protein